MKKKKKKMESQSETGNLSDGGEYEAVDCCVVCVMFGVVGCRYGC